MRSLRLGAGYVQGVSRIRYNDSDESNTYSSILTTVLLISTRERTVTRPSHPAARCVHFLPVPSLVSHRFTLEALTIAVGPYAPYMLRWPSARRSCA